MYQEFERSALEFVAEARKIALRHYASKDKFIIKSDGSPVTQADLEIENYLRKAITQRYPDHAIIGEEQAAHQPSRYQYSWVIDPIDGTQSFAAGMPTFGILLALQKATESVVGVVDYPALNRCFHASKANGARLNGQLISVNDARSDFEVIASSTRAAYARTGEADKFDQLIAAFPYLRIYYDCFPFGMLAQGQLACLVEYNLRLWDIAPAEILIKEAGGEWRMLSTWQCDDGQLRYRVVMGRRASVEKVTAILEQNPACRCD